MLGVGYWLLGVESGPSNPWNLPVPPLPDLGTREPPLASLLSIMYDVKALFDSSAFAKRYIEEAGSQAADVADAVVIELTPEVVSPSFVLPDRGAWG
jgi:hypothetical protein